LAIRGPAEEERVATIRAATGADGHRLQDIERLGGEAFRELGMAAIADDEPFTEDELARFRNDGHSWVIVDDTDVPMGYLVVDVVDGNLHVEQVTVDPAYAGRGLGAALIEHADAYAAAHRHPALTLTTFTEVAWNAPYYRRLGFRDMTAAEIGPELGAVRRAEAEHGLDRWPRVCMIRPVRKSS
jgi:GNAT superfamily N-acetyltransferase